LAEEGFTVSPVLARYIDNRKHDLARLPETRAIFYKADGTPYVEGDHFRQLALAETLRRVAMDGADYMYSGAWAARCVEAVQRDGGKMELDDLCSKAELLRSPCLASLVKAR
jgi:gamma-glutamyltranspeptidase/glutathione hydrolase